MPLTRCRNFDENGSRRTRSNGTEVLCHPNCQFIHPSDRDWDRARPATVRGRGGPPRGGRGRGQSSFGVLASGANAHSLGSERASSSSTWDDYVTGFGSNPPATSSAKGPSLWSSQGTSGWGDAGASGSGWGSNANNNVGASDGWSSEPAATGGNAPSSQWDSQSAEWGSSGNGWGNFSSTGWVSAGNDHGAGWGQDPNSDQGGKAPLATAVQNAASPPGPDAQSGGGWTNDNPDAATLTTLSSQAIQPVITSNEPDLAHSEHRGEDISVPVMVNPLPLGYEASSTASLEQPLSANPINEPQMRSLPDDSDSRVISTLLGSETSRIMLYLTVALKMRKLKAELLQFSALRKSRQLPKARAVINLLEIKSQKFEDAQLAVEAEHRAYSRWLPRSDSLGLPVVQLTSTREKTQLDQLKDWISRAEGCLGHVQAEGIPISPAKDFAGASFVSKLKQLTERSESLAGTHWQCQDLQFYNTFLDHQIQDKKEVIVAAIVRSQDEHYSYLLSASVSTLQKQGEMWNQVLQMQAGELAQALLQSHQLGMDGKSRSSITAKQNDTIQQLQTSISQKKLHLQVLQEEIVQLQHALASMKKQQSHTTTTDYLDVYIPHIQGYIQKYIKAKAIYDIKIAFNKAIAGFITMEPITIEKVWKALQPSMQMSIWLQHSEIYNTEEESEMKEIEQSLLG